MSYNRTVSTADHGHFRRERRRLSSKGIITPLSMIQPQMMVKVGDDWKAAMTTYTNSLSKEPIYVA